MVFDLLRRVFLLVPLNGLDQAVSPIPVCGLIGYAFTHLTGIKRLLMYP